MKNKLLNISLLIHILVFLTTPAQISMAAGKIQNEDVKSLADLTAAGGTMSQLINDSKIYVTANSLNEQLSTAIANGDLGGGSGINYISNFKGSQGTTGWSVCNETQTVTITIASPAVFTDSSAHGFSLGQPLTFSTTGALPTGLTAGTTYYVSLIPSSTTYQVSATLGGTAVNTSGTQSGTHTQYPAYPISCSSGSLSGLSFTSTSSSPLRTNYSNFVLTQTNSTKVQGQGINYAFTIGSADQAKVLSIQLDYNASSTFVASGGLAGSAGSTGVDSDLEFFIYDVTNSILIPVSPKVITAQGSNNFTFKGVFQTNSNSTSYKLIIYAATPNSNSTGWTFKFTNIQVGPQVIVQGPAITDFINAGPTILGATTTAPTKGTMTVDNMYWRRVGDSMEVFFNFNQTSAGSAGSGDYLIQIPTGYSIDLTKVQAYSNIVSANIYGLLSEVGHNVLSSFGTGSSTANGPVVVYDSTHVRFFANNSSNATQGAFGASFFALSVQPTIYAYAFFKIPIVGWSSTSQMSSDTDSRVVSTTVSGSAASTSGTVIFPTSVFDKTGSYNTSTGVFTVPVSGVYDLYGYFSTTNAVTYTLYSNGSTTSRNICTAAASSSCSGIASINSSAGDQLTLVVSGSTGGTVSGHINFSRKHGPTTIAQIETISARYYSSATSLSSSLATIVYATQDNDSHSAYSSGIFTCPATGRYAVAAALLVSGTIALNNTLIMEIQHNGTVVERETQYAGGAVTNLKGRVVSDNIRCLAGDTVRIQTSTTVTSPSIVSSNFDNSFSITRVGNY